MMLKGSSGEKPEKIILAGIENAGKTSLLRAFENKFTCEDSTSGHAPTLGLKKGYLSIANQKFVRWELGGQEKFRQEYLQNKEVYFSNLKMLYFVIDIQDKGTIPTAIVYLHEIISYLDQNKKDLPVVVLLNKYDDNWSTDIDLNANIVQTQFAIQDAIGAHRVHFFLTSALHPESVLHAFSQTLTQVLPPLGIIRDLLQDLANQYSLLGVYLLNADGLTIAEHLKPGLTVQEKKLLATAKNMAIRKICERNLDHIRFIDEAFNEGPLYSEIRAFPEDTKTYFLYIITNQKRIISDSINPVLARSLRLLSDILQINHPPTTF